MITTTSTSVRESEGRVGEDDIKQNRPSQPEDITGDEKDVVGADQPGATT
jgi:hypothetical protein